MVENFYEVICGAHQEIIEISDTESNERYLYKEKGKWREEINITNSTRPIHQNHEIVRQAAILS
ncbi:24572_t:CDS:2, partial [Racocetra persica]